MEEWSGDVWYETTRITAVEAIERDAVSVAVLGAAFASRWCQGVEV